MLGVAIAGFAASVSFNSVIWSPSAKRTLRSLLGGGDPGVRKEGFGIGGLAS